jgi:hypothetical protein
MEYASKNFQRVFSLLSTTFRIILITPKSLTSSYISGALQNVGGQVVLSIFGSLIKSLINDCDLT